MVAVVCLATAALACGPYFNNRLLTRGDEAVLPMPAAGFAHEVQRLLPVDAAAFDAVPPGADRTPHTQTRDVDLAELRAVVSRPRMTDADPAVLLREYAEVRDRLADHALANDHRRERGEAVQPLPPRVTPPKGLPIEFDDYLRGAIAYHSGKRLTAIRHWKQLLDRPAAIRHHRSTWAAYMIGRAMQSDDPEGACVWFERTRALAGDGFADGLGLAAASLGWQARAMLDLHRPDEAMRLYFQQWHSGDGGALPSLRTAILRLLEDEGEPMRRAAADPLLQPLVTALIVAQGGYASHRWQSQELLDKHAPAWLAAVEAVAGEAPGAERLAWASYQRGDFDAAARWAQRAGDDDAVATWVRAKLAMRAGRLDDAAALLALASRRFPADESWPALSTDDNNVQPVRDASSELAVLQLTRQQYVESLDLLLRHEHPEDAAYIAEWVLSLDELSRYVDRHWPADPPRGQLQQQWYGEASDSIRHLLACRLTRAGRWKEARPYYPPKLRLVLDDYVAAIRRGADEAQPRADRAEAYWQAAILAMRGEAILGFYAQPIYHVEGRDALHPRLAQHRRAPGDNRVVVASPDEIARLDAHAPEFARDLHYPFIAADHAWRACELMDDGSDELARRLCLAGSWIKYRDPKAAQRLFHALTTRCPATDLGRRAAARKWFPILDDDPDYAAK